ncbi:hypothetical protein D920_00241, partial [Enterococcus faecalis 13-SD-W-01]
IDEGYGGAIIWELAHDTPDTAEMTSLVENILTGTHVDGGEEAESVKQSFAIGGQAVAAHGSSHQSGFPRITLEVQDRKASLVKHSDYQFHWSHWINRRYASIKITDPTGEVLFDKSWNANQPVVGNGFRTFGTFAQYEVPEGSTVEIYHAEGPWHRFRTSNDQDLKTKLGNNKYTFIYTMKNNKLELTSVR